MTEGSKRMMKDHPWPGPSHDLPDSLFHLRPVAMDGTFLASGLILAETASVQAAMGIVQQLPAAGAQFGMSFALPAIEAYHLLHYRLFFLYVSASHRYRYNSFPFLVAHAFLRA